MSESRSRLRGTIWAPKALVVISCALALLAVQPSGAAPVSRNRPIVLKYTSPSIAPAAWDISRHSAVAAPRPNLRNTYTAQAFFGDSQRLHILATVEILQRLLCSHLQPTQPQYFASLWLLAQCPAVTVLEPVSSTTTRKPIPHRPVPEVEKAFAMAHCQLAPPLATTI